jgi:tetratricopeptide (TPR) repeat protein
MIHIIRTLTFLIAIAFIIASIFYANPDRELTGAHQAYQLGDMDQTLRLARRAYFSSENDQKKTDALYLVAKASNKMGRIDVAKKYLDKLLALDPTNIRTLLYRGELEYLLGDTRQALSDLNKGLNGSIENLSKSTQAYYHAQRGLSYLTLQNTDKAEEDAHTAMALDPELPDAWDLMSKVLEVREDIKGAYEACEKAYNLSIARNKLSFMSPKGRKLSDRLVKLRVKLISDK